MRNSCRRHRSVQVGKLFMANIYAVHCAVEPVIFKETVLYLSNDPGKVDSNFFCYAATVLSPHRNVLIFTQRMHKPT